MMRREDMTEYQLEVMRLILTEGRINVTPDTSEDVKIACSNFYLMGLISPSVTKSMPGYNYWYIANSNEVLKIFDVVLNEPYAYYDGYRYHIHEGHDWIGTHSGIKFYPLCPRQDDMTLDDVAYGLARTIRFNGQAGVETVAEHSVLLSYAVPEEFALEALFHDVEEAWFPDMPGPLSGFFKQIKEIKDNIRRCWFDKINLSYPIDPVVKEYELRLLINEKRDLFPQDHPRWGVENDYEALPEIRIREWDPDMAEQCFLSRYMELGYAI